tara:strand:+ start:1140 stop:1469 length:330 start_codon:yes stop_codon:yes gene_type:complete
MEVEIKKKGKGKIILYTLPYCSHCQEIKLLLNQHEIPFNEIDIDANPALGDIIEEEQKTESYPIIYFQKKPGEFIYLLSETDLVKLNNIRIFNTIDEALEILLQYYYEI